MNCFKIKHIINYTSIIIWQLIDCVDARYDWKSHRWRDCVKVRYDDWKWWTLRMRRCREGGGGGGERDTHTRNKKTYLLLLHRSPCRQTEIRLDKEHWKLTRQRVGEIGRQAKGQITLGKQSIRQSTWSFRHRLSAKYRYWFYLPKGVCHML